MISKKQYVRRGIILILCLLVVAPASAITVSPGIMTQNIRQPGTALVPVNRTAEISFDSSIRGAMVFLDGNLLGADEARSRTPVTANVITGNHTATFRLAGYRETTASFHVDAGKPLAISVRLEPSVNAGAVQQEMTLSLPRQPQPAALPPVAEESSAPAGFFNRFITDLFGGIFSRTPEKTPVKMTISALTLSPGIYVINDGYTVAPVIDKGATVFIGEQGLNVTHALNQARGTYPYGTYNATIDAAYNAVPAPAVIGYWVNHSEVYTTSPSRTIDLSITDRYRHLMVDPADFVGYTGNWYLLNAAGTSPFSTDSVVFSVEDPQLDLQVLNTAFSAEGTTVSRGDPLRFWISRQIFLKKQPGMPILRFPQPDSRDNGFIDIVVKNPDGKILEELNVTTYIGPTALEYKTNESLLQSCWNSWADDGLCSGNTWDTGAVYSNGTPMYPSGTYTVYVISKLNNMHNNYRNAGQWYIGKTVSDNVTFTLA